VILAGSGQILIELQSRPFELKAGLPGVVVDLVEERGVTIEATGALIQAVWGNGGVDFGLMNVLAKTPDQPLTPDLMVVSMRGSIIMGGHVADREALKSATELPLRGLILASLDPSLATLAANLGVPVVLLDGFGQAAMNWSAFRLLATNDRREVAINAEPWDRFTGDRPEIVIPLPATAMPAMAVDALNFAENQPVRIASAPHRGRIGTILELRGVVSLPNGVRAPAADVRLDDGSTVLLPLANLDVLQ
jgi:hypothetical protein